MLDKEGDVYLAGFRYVLMMAQQDFPDIKFHFTSEFYMKKSILHPLLTC